MFNLKNLLLIGTAAHVVLLLTHFGMLLGSEQKFMFPLLLVSAWLIMRSRKVDIQEFLDDARSRNTLTGLGTFGFLAVILVASLASLGDISFLGWMSFILLWCVVVVAAWGIQGLKLFLPLIILAFLVRPLPDFIDDRLQGSLRSIEIYCASLGLDLLQVMHFRDSDSIQLVLMDFSADLACSKVFMIYPAIWLIVTHGLIARYTWLRHAVQITQTTFWVVVLNAIHIVAVLLIEQNGTTSIASGTGHYIALGVLLLAISWFSLSTDSLFCSIVPNPNMPDEIEEMERAQIASGLNWSVIVDGIATRLNSVAVPIVRWTAIVAGFAMILFISVRIYLAPTTDVSQFDLASIQPLAWQRESLPGEINGWKLVVFGEKSAPDSETPSYEKTVLWGYKKDNREIAFSVTGPYVDYTEPSPYYLGAGWKLSIEPDYSPIGFLLSGRKDSAKNVALMRLSKDSGERGLVVCSCMDRSGRIVPPRLSLTKNYREYAIEKFYASAMYVVGLRASPNTRSILFQPPVYLIQFSHEFNERVKIKDDEAYEIFKTCRRAVQAAIRVTPPN